MPVPLATTQTELSTPGPRSRPTPIEIQLTSSLKSTDTTQTPPSVGPGAYDDTVVPPSHGTARTLVLCFDGTGDQFDADNSNIVQFFSMLKKDDKSQQLVYYQAGIGTYMIPEIATPSMSRVHKNIDMALGHHLDAHIMGGYEFLMENYHAEDKICIFGFSRGAYTARALAGMIHKVGLLPAGNHQQVPFAYKMYSRDDKVGWDQSKVFKKAFSVDVEIEFIGVWDTVCSVGFAGRTLPFTASNTAVRYFRHAVSLDEHRAKFKANYFHLLNPDDTKGTKPGEMPRSNQLERHPFYHSSHRHHHLHHHHKDKKQAEEEYDDRPWETDVLEVWFAGCHCDIGGGSVPNGTRNSLARIPLRWMIRQCFLKNTGIQFHRDSFKDIGLDVNSIFPVVLPRPPALKASAFHVADVKPTTHAAEPTVDTLIGDVPASPTAASTFKTEEEEELADAQSEIYDQLKRSKAWWILEILPQRFSKQNRGDASWKTYWAMNMARGREIPEPLCDSGEKVLVHRSVKIRMETEGLKYVPKAKFDHLDYEWVD
ncbi:hypothetical protein BJV78DRAFT_1372674 [Lactifluus subvellereus]|nr:hypothetical protein BJV78DRAFT_1372674 [Lactifluus subvellereus]